MPARSWVSWIELRDALADPFGATAAFIRVPAASSCPASLQGLIPTLRHWVRAGDANLRQRSHKGPVLGAQVRRSHQKILCLGLHAEVRPSRLSRQTISQQMLDFCIDGLQSVALELITSPALECRSAQALQALTEALDRAEASPLCIAALT